MRDCWSDLIIETAINGGYMVREWKLRPGDCSQYIFACSTKEELFQFLRTALMNKDPSHAQSSGKGNSE